MPIGEKLLAEDGVGPLGASLSEHAGLLGRAGFGAAEGRRTGVALRCDSGGKRREWGICLTQVIALPSAWWGGPPGPRRTSGCWQAGQGAGRGRGRPPHIAPQNGAT